MNVKLLSQMRQVVDEQTGLSPQQRRAARRAVALVEAKWKSQHQQRYRGSLKVRNEQWRGVEKRGKDGAADVRQLVADVKAGQVSTDDALAKLHDHQTTHNRLTDQYNAIMDRDEELEAFEAMTPDEFQAEQLKRFPVMLSSQPSLAQLVAEEMDDGRWLARPNAPSIEDRFPALSTADAR